MRNKLVFLRNGKRQEISNFSPDETLLDYLRLIERKTGTKEGCNEGDCGACTVSLGRIRNGTLSYEPVNACILLLGQIDGADLITVDDLAENGKLHSVQKAMVDHHGAQCGFCTPGFVMTLFSMHHSGEKVTRNSINDWLAGNLCRCTGYRPIADAAMASVSQKPNDALMKRWDETEKALKKLQSNEDLVVMDGESVFGSPGTIDYLAEACVRYPEATIVSGATDVGLWITKQLRAQKQIIWTGRAKGFDSIKSSAKQLVIGAGATYRDAYDALSQLDSDIEEVFRRLGSRHVRASGTIGGNIANGSPIGDSPPILIALGASLELRHDKETRTLPLEDFFIDYGKQDRKVGELVAKIIVPKPKKNEYVRAFKISKRFDQDISALLFALKVAVQRDRIVSVRLACGGMAGTPKRAKQCEAKLLGIVLADETSWEGAIAALTKDYAPLSDMRASAEYRMKTAQNLLRKALIEIADETAGKPRAQTRVSGFREAAE
jgi:xanthine dehydrogenase small subunit